MIPRAAIKSARRTTIHRSGFDEKDVFTGRDNLPGGMDCHAGSGFRPVFDLSRIFAGHPGYTTWSVYLHGENVDGILWRNVLYLLISLFFVSVESGCGPFAVRGFFRLFFPTCGFVFSVSFRMTGVVSFGSGVSFLQPPVLSVAYM